MTQNDNIPTMHVLLPLPSELWSFEDQKAFSEAILQSPTVLTDAQRTRNARILARIDARERRRGWYSRRQQAISRLARIRALSQ